MDRSAAPREGTSRRPDRRDEASPGVLRRHEPGEADDGHPLGHVDLHARGDDRGDEARIRGDRLERRRVLAHVDELEVDQHGLRVGERGRLEGELRALQGREGVLVRIGDGVVADERHVHLLDGRG